MKENEIKVKNKLGLLIRVAKFPSRLAGKIMLDVEKKGEAYYVNPKDMKGYFLNKPSAAFGVMRELGLGITLLYTRHYERSVKTCYYEQRPSE